MADTPKQDDAKQQQLRHIVSNPVIKALKPGEPFFVLRASDAMAPDVIRYWAKVAGGAGTPLEKVQQAYEIADLFERFPNRKVPD